jgi:hypothetical protein
VFISSFSYEYDPYIGNNLLPIMCIEPESNNMWQLQSTVSDGMSYTSIDDMNGNTSLFNNLSSVLKIDINHIFTFYFYSILKGLINISTTTTVEEVPAFEIYRKFHSDLNSQDEDITKKIEDILVQYHKEIEASAILCYMTYAGKLIGAKEDMVQWLYTTFIKGTVSDIEKGDFTNSADITAFSGHQLRSDIKVNDYEHPIINNFIDKSKIDNEKTLNMQLPDKSVMWNTGILYKHLRLNYSNWCTVINLISNFKRDYSRHNISEDDIRNKPNDFLFANNTDLNDHLSVAKYILTEYISHYFATYNVFVFPTEKEVTVASFFISFVANRIFNAEIKSIINDICDISNIRSKKISEHFVNSEKAIGILYAIKLVKNVLADLFMIYSYVIMLNGVYNTQDRILDEKDPLTGRSKKELFLEIYHSLIKKIDTFLNNNGSWIYKDLVVFAGSNQINQTEWNYGGFKELDTYIKGIYTPLKSYINSNNITITADIQNIRQVLDKITSPLTLDKSKFDSNIINSVCRDKYGNNCPGNNNSKIYTYFLTKLYDIHPISVMAELSEYYSNKTSNTEMWKCPMKELVANTGFTRSGNLFPRNRVTSELLHKVRLYEPKLFASSLESLDNILVEAKEDAILGNNANYSFIGSIGGTVTNEEDNIENITNQASPLPGDNSIKFQNGVGIEGLPAGLDPVTLHRNQVDNIANHWNELFKIAVLGGKELIVP